MRATWILLLGLAACGGSDGAACPTGALEADDDGCSCAGEEFERRRDGEVCSCGDDGLDCAPAPGDTAAPCRRSIDCG